MAACRLFRRLCYLWQYPCRSCPSQAHQPDVTAQYHLNVDVTDPPFNRHPDETPAMTAQDEADIIEFLKTLNHGYEPEKTAAPN
jgi:cytochrome c peroxidase